LSGQGVVAGELGGVAGLGGDLEESVPFGGAFGPGGGADLDLAGSPADGEVGEPVVLGVSGACRDHAGVAELAAASYGVLGGGEGAALVGFDEYGVGDTVLCGGLDAGAGGGEQVVTEDLDVLECGGGLGPAVPVLVVEGVWSATALATAVVEL
jgi:hypothetical protein